MLTSENLSGLGGPMGTERTTINFYRYFKSFVRAKKEAEKDYLSQKPDPAEKITWSGQRKEIHTQDLRFVMYSISPVTVE